MCIARSTAGSEMCTILQFRKMHYNAFIHVGLTRADRPPP